VKQTAERTLALIGNILATVEWFILFLLAGLLLIEAGAQPGKNGLIIAGGLLIAGNLAVVPVLVFGWVAGFMIRPGGKGWPICLIVAGALLILSPFIVSGLLLAAAGLLAVLRPPFNEL
jgi:hypothetical protein